MFPFSSSWTSCHMEEPSTASQLWATSRTSSLFLEFGRGEVEPAAGFPACCEADALLSGADDVTAGVDMIFLLFIVESVYQDQFACSPHVGRPLRSKRLRQK
mmetsp:Transcript_30199/g.55479  ORF Transcript_30199/g.55479 Transcript_30199/m.55479 type:complete len:102 (-) Transcript_30199:45-350(-)